MVVGYGYSLLSTKDAKQIKLFIIITTTVTAE